MASPEDRKARENNRISGSTSSDPTSHMGETDDQNHSKALSNKGDSRTQKTDYACKPSSQILGTNQGPPSEKSRSSAEKSTGIVNANTWVEAGRSSPDPPVTKATLSELDVPRIVYNPKLRHDVNYDPDLHFRPNLDGDSGRRKAQRATGFWTCLRIQLEAFMHDQVAFEAAFKDREWCLPLTLQAVGEILGTLVPPEDRAAVEQILNVEHLMQQFRKGVADLEKLASWLSCTLKSHCAPMRDEWVDEMEKALSVGNSTSDVSMIVKGLQTLLGVLEAMKLDVANHQIRCLRPLLIQDTVEFERNFFMKKISLREIDVGSSYAWFQVEKRALEESQQQCRNLERDLWVFFRGFANLLLPSKMGVKLPDTFKFDEERIMKLRSDILDAINLDLCIRTLQKARDEESANKINAKITTSALTWSFPNPSTGTSTLLTCRCCMPSPISSPSKKMDKNTLGRDSGQWAKKKLSNVNEWSRGSEVGDEDSDTESAATSRTSSFSSTTSAPNFPTSQSMGSSGSVEELALRQSILAIIDDTSGNDRWQQSRLPIALQLARTSNLEYNSLFESELERHLSNSASFVFQASESNILAEFFPVLSTFAARYISLTSTQLFEVATSPRPLPSQAPKPRSALADIAKHMAHIGILHWRVWAHLAYLFNPDVDETSAPTDAGHTGDAPEQESQKSSNNNGDEAKSSRRRTPQRQNSLSETIPAGT